MGDGRYRLETFVGRGPASTVYTAHDVRLRRDVAVRVFDHPVDNERVAAAAQVWTAGLSRILDAGTDGTVATDGPVGTDRTGAGARHDFVVREVVHGLSLLRLTGAVECRPTTIAAVGASVAATLAALHARGTAHGGLHPGNIFLRDFANSADWGRDAEDGTVLTDFGVGSRCSGRPDPADDIRALGASLLGVLTRRAVTGSRTAGTALTRLRRHSGLTAAQRVAWHDLLAALIDPDPTRRPDAVEAVGSLRRLRAEQPR